MERRLRAIDFFGGAGGWAIAARGLPIDVVMAIDWWQPACMTYRLNHPRTLVVRADLKHAPLHLEKIAGMFDVMLGGIPCHWLSSYRNWSDRSAVKEAERVEGRALIDSVLEIVRRGQPPFWCLEDVTQLITELPPMTPHQIIEAEGFSGQRRKRVYVGEFPSPRPGYDRRVFGNYVRRGPYRIGRRLLGRRPQTTRTFAADVCLAAYMDRKAPTVCGWCSRRDGELAVLDSRVPGGMRQIEWQESAALQGYPDDYLFYGSPTDVAVMVGNSIQIDTARAILTEICNAAATRRGAA